MEACDYALPTQQGEKGKEKEKKGKGDGDRQKKRGLVGRSPVTVARGSVTSIVANKQGRKSEEVEAAGPSRDGRRRSRSPGGTSSVDGVMPANRSRGTVRQKTDLREPDTDEIKPVTDVVPMMFLGNGGQRRGLWPRRAESPIP